MAPTLQPQFLPETDIGELSQYRVSGSFPINGLLKELIAHRALIALYARGNFDDFVVTQVTRIDDRSIDFAFVTDDARRSAILASDGVIVIGFLESIKVQFSTNTLSIVDAPDGSVLRCTIPFEMFRIQRRDAYRVRPLSSEPVTCHVRDGKGGETVFRVIDFSVTGLSLLAAPGMDLPSEGQAFAHSRIEIGQRIAIPCEVVIHHVGKGLDGDQGGHRLGCEFRHLSSDAARSIQLAVMDIEKRSRIPTFR
jgi:flagellar brake protein